MREIKTRRDLMKALADGYTMEYKSLCGRRWDTIEVFDFYRAQLDDVLIHEYRIKPTKPSIDWNQVSENYHYLARDDSGEVFLYEDRPTKDEQIWLPEVGGAISASVFKSLEAGTCDWRDSLVERPKIKGV